MALFTVHDGERALAVLAAADAATARRVAERQIEAVEEAGLMIRPALDCEAEAWRRVADNADESAGIIVFLTE